MIKKWSHLHWNMAFWAHQATFTLRKFHDTFITIRMKTREYFRVV
jgi:hypothetical protein